MLHFFKRNLFVLAVIGTHSFNSQALNLSKNYQLLKLTSKYLTVPIKLSINLSEILTLSVNITLAAKESQFGR